MTPPVGRYPTLVESAFNKLTSGAAVLCVDSDSGPIGMTLSSFTAASLDPPLLRVSTPASSVIWPVMTQSARLGLNVLWADQITGDTNLPQSDAFPVFDWGWYANENGAVFLSEAPAWFECSMYTEFFLGDRVVALLRVYGMKI